MLHQAEFLRSIIFGLAAAMMMTTAAFSQVIIDSSTQEPDTETGDITGFDVLSTGNQKIAVSLFDAQNAGDGGESWMLDDIAAAKQDGSGWGNIFKQMKEEGLIAEKNLGQVVSGKGMTDAGFGRANKAQVSTLQRNTVYASSGRLLRPRRTSLVVTTANGRRVVVGLKKPGLRPGLRYGSSAKASARAGRVTRGGYRRSSFSGALTASRAAASLSAGRTVSAASSARSHGRGGGKRAGKIK